MRVDKESFIKTLLIFCLIGGIACIISAIQEELVGGAIIGVIMVLSFFLFYPFGKK